MSIDLNLHQYYESMNILEGALDPLDGFMTSKDLANVMKPDMRLDSGEIFPLPVLLDISQSTASDLKTKNSIDLYFEQQRVCTLEITDIFKPNKEKIAAHCFGTLDTEHPGIQALQASESHCVAGRLVNSSNIRTKENYLTPKSTKQYFTKKGWKTIAGFQTRNVPHKAHEYLHRLALEMVDALMIQPLVGWKKPGDYTPEAIQAAYNVMIDQFYPKDHVLFNLLYTPMRYAGPKEALFHAIIRRNFGCTHFIVGRDHAGVKNYYGVYEAQEFCLAHEKEIGIQIIATREPFYCKKCDAIVIERHCNHSENPQYRENISGTMIRNMLVNKESVDSRYLRQETLDSLNDLKIFI